MTTHRPPCTIIVVDDEVLVLDLLEQTVSHCGYDVRTAMSEAEGVALLSLTPREDLAGLVTDVNLGGGTGWEVARRARLLKPDLPVVYVTGDSGHEWERQGVSGSVLVTKPLTCSDLAAALAAVVGGADKRRRAGIRRRS